ncbi:MAG TPA: carboxypeptidase-like regulatory domain-containing protein [Fimbriimonadaceae bacterium]|nr:carboxypeptidase-like regulatory domain-containing protein [Fimbriimonadaceae bacterium]
MLAAIGATLGQGRKTWALSGVVQDEHGNAVAGADVYVTQWDIKGDKCDVVETTKSDKGGHFIAHIGDYKTKWIRDRIWATAPNRGTAVSNPNPNSDVELVLPRAATLRVHLLDPGGKPLANEPMQSYMAGDLPPPLAARFSAVTDANGVCEFVGNPREGVFLRNSDVRLSSYNHGIVYFPAEAETLDQEIRLEKAITIVGSVESAESGERIPNVAVVLTQLVNGPPDLYPPVTTDRSGHFEFHQLRPGPYSVRVRDPRFGIKLDSVWSEDAPEGAMVYIPIFKLSTPGHVRCLVTNSITHRPAGDQYVSAKWEQGTQKFMTSVGKLSGADGVIDLNLQPGRYTLEIDGVRHTCEVESGETCSLAFEVTPAPSGD